MKKNIRTSKRLHQAFGWIVLGVLVDQMTKFLAVMYVLQKPFVLIPSFLRFEVVYNTGIAFGFLPQARWFLIIFTLVILLFGWQYYERWHLQSRWFYWGGILFFAGTLGNFFDRLFFGQVTDFIAVRFGAYQFPFFNLADSFLVVSVCVILIGIYLDDDAKKGERSDG